jgi:2-polyprenyl-3-methyl-5-hydroxy-6-metoxy-1,4-benzoquinol methylase
VRKRVAISMTIHTNNVKSADAQLLSREWWQSNPMTYDWENTLRIRPGTREWYEEIDRRFLESAYYASRNDAGPFGRFLKRELVDGKRVLEVGCGMGTHAEMLVRNGADLTAIDQTTFAVASTKRRFLLKQLNGQIVQQDADSLAFPEGTFDFVWTWGVIHHSSSTERCVDEIARVLKPGGRLTMMVYYRPSLVYYVHCGLIRGICMGQLFGRSLNEIYVASTDGFYSRVFTKPELHVLLSEHFHSLRIAVVGLKAEIYPIPRGRMKLALEKLTPDWLAEAILGRFGSMVVVEAIRS